MPRNDDMLNQPRRGGEDEPLDFGEFVSSNVQRTSDKLKGEPGAVPSPPSGRPEGDRTIERVKDRSYWRRKAADAGMPADDGEDVPPPQDTSRRNRYLPPDDEEINQFHDENEFDDRGDGGGFGGFFADFFSDDGDGGNRNRIIAAILALLVLVAIIFGITRLFGDDDSGDGIAPTPTATEIVQPPSTPDTTAPTPPADGDETTPATDEPEIPRGGDNQRGEEEGGVTPVAATSPTEIASADLTSEVARACSGLCLVRVVGADQESALENAGARASWADGDISWVVVNPTQAELLDADHELTLIENDPRTYNLYIVKAPEDQNDREIVTPHGEIIDETGRYYLVRWSGVPAVVKPVTDWGYAVFKIAPAPPTTIAEVGRNGPAADTNGWDLMSQVNQDNVVNFVDEFTNMGELDNSGYGSRYYTFPGNQIAADYLYQELESYGLTVWYEDFIMWDGYLLVNVVAEIPGADDSEVYAVMAHLDTINLDNPRVAPGSDDNASGISVTLEIARILSSYELNHPVRIVFVNAEEVGIVGAPAWAKESNRNNVPIAGVFNVDSVGSIRNRPIVITNADANSAWMQQLMTDVNNEYGLQETFQHKQSEFIVADDNFVRAEGIPAVMVARELYGLNEFHHTLGDIPENISIGGTVDTTNLILLCVWTLAG